MVVSRDVDATGAGNAHSFTDSSVYSRTNVSHNCYDDRTKTTGASAAGHHASYQVGAEFAISGGGTFGNLYSFITSPTISGGTLALGSGASISNSAAIILGSGATFDAS